jgi:hypothetical protein
MRLIKTLGLASMVLAAFMATVGATAAVATTELEEVVLCAKREHNCPAGQHFPGGTEIFATATSTEFLSNVGTVTCAASELHAKNTGLLVHGTITALAFGECKLQGGGECTVTAEHLEYLFKGELKSDHVKYEVRVTEKPSNGIPQVSVECSGFISCTYAAKEVSVEAKLAFTPERLSVLQELTTVKGFFCGSAPVWHGTYNATCRESEGAELKNCWVKMEQII